MVPVGTGPDTRRVIGMSDRRRPAPPGPPVAPWLGFEALAAADCRRLLAGADIGRMALTTAALPVVVPVQFVVDDDHLMVRTPGHLDVAGLDGQVVGFECDTLDLDHAAGWVVEVTGTVHLVTEHPAPDPVHRWFSDGAVLSLDAERISGHRVVV